MRLFLAGVAVVRSKSPAETLKSFQAHLREGLDISF